MVATLAVVAAVAAIWYLFFLRRKKKTQQMQKQQQQVHIQESKPELEAPYKPGISARVHESNPQPIYESGGQEYHQVA